MTFTENYYYNQETGSFHCWEYRKGSTYSKLYVPKWRVPKPIPKAITVAVSTSFEFEENRVTERDTLRQPEKRGLPIVVLGERVSSHEHTVRFDIANNNRQINSLYIPYSFSEPNIYVKKVMIKVLWGQEVMYNKDNIINAHKESKDKVLALYLVDDSIIKVGYIYKCPYCSELIKYESRDLAIYSDSSKQKIDRYVKLSIMHCNKCNRYYSKQEDLHNHNVQQNQIKIIQVDQDVIRRNSALKVSEKKEMGKTDSNKKADIARQVKEAKKECAATTTKCIYCDEKFSMISIVENIIGMRWQNRNINW